MRSGSELVGVLPAWLLPGNVLGELKAACKTAVAGSLTAFCSSRALAAVTLRKDTNSAFVRWADKCELCRLTGGESVDLMGIQVVIPLVGTAQPWHTDTTHVGSVVVGVDVCHNPLLTQLYIDGDICEVAVPVFAFLPTALHRGPATSNVHTSTRVFAVFCDGSLPTRARNKIAKDHGFL